MNTITFILNIMAMGLYAASVNAAETAAIANPLLAGPGMGQIIFALVLVIALLWGLIWFLKRFGLGKIGMQRSFMKVISVSNLGTREKIALVEIGDTWLVLGMTAAAITTLHTLPKNSIPVPGQPDPAQAFAKLLEKVKRPPSTSQSL